MALKQDYPPGFEKVWNAFSTQFGSKGSKPRALIEFNKLKLTESEVIELVDIIERQKAEKLDFRMTGQFCENFQHCERYLKNRRWEDDENRPELTIPTQALSKRDQTRAAIASLTGEGSTNTDGAFQVGELRLIK